MRKAAIIAKNERTRNEDNMSVTLDDTRKCANLSRLGLSNDQLNEITPKLDNIVGFIDQLAEVDTDNVEPLASVVDITLRLREDEVTDGGYQKEILSNAPDTQEGYFVVPKVVE